MDNYAALTREHSQSLGKGFHCYGARKKIAPYTTIPYMPNSVDENIILGPGQIVGDVFYKLLTRDAHHQSLLYEHIFNPRYTGPGLILRKIYIYHLHLSLW